MKKDEVTLEQFNQLAYEFAIRNPRVIKLLHKDEIIMIQDRLNHRPRKVLKYKTPYEVFMSESSRKMAT